VCSPEQPDCTPNGTLGYYPHVSTEPLHAIIVLTPHFTNTFTHSLVFISHRQPEPVPHKQTPSEHGYPDEKPTKISDYQVLHAYHQTAAYPPYTGEFISPLRRRIHQLDRP